MNNIVGFTGAVIVVCATLVPGKLPADVYEIDTQKFEIAVNYNPAKKQNIDHL